MVLVVGSFPCLDKCIDCFAGFFGVYDLFAFEEMKKLKGIDGQLDLAWSELVKLKAGNKCEIQNCGKTNIQSHHIYTRRNKAVRWEPMNGVSLCAWHHTLNSKFSAHATPVTFTEWLIENKGEDYMQILRMKANQISKLHKFEKEVLLSELKREINEINP